MFQNNLLNFNCISEMGILDPDESNLANWSLSMVIILTSSQGNIVSIDAQISVFQKVGDIFSDQHIDTLAVSTGPSVSVATKW